MDIAEVYKSLKELISGYGSVLVAFSGGVDSTVVAKASADTLGSKAIAITIVSESFSGRSMERVIALSKEIGIELILYQVSKTANIDYSRNFNDRCYHCKSIDASIMKKIANERSIRTIVDGVNAEDMNDYRPGLRASMEYSIFHPLAELKLKKNEVRDIARHLKLTNAELPADSCLSSRIAYYEKIDKEKLKMIEMAERFLLDLGFSNVRVRMEGKSARIELPKSEILWIIADGKMEKITEHLRGLGFAYVSLDLEGLKHGSMNRII